MRVHQVNRVYPLNLRYRLLLSVPAQVARDTDRPVAGGGAGGFEPPPPTPTKMNSCQWKLKFQSIVDHSKIMYCCSSVQFGIV